MELKRAPISLLVLVSIALAGVAHIFAFGMALGPWRAEWFLTWIPRFLVPFIAWWIALGIAESLTRVKQLKDPDTGQIDVIKLWRSGVFQPAPVHGSLVVAAMVFGVMGSTSLTEAYVSRAGHWFDVDLWALEGPFIEAAVGSWLDVPTLWDKVYWSLWPTLIGACAFLYRVSPRARFVEFALTIVIAFYFTRLINLVFPTAGPVFFSPDVFRISGTMSAEVQPTLQAYMVGAVDQNGLMLGTMAMPSLHVGLVAITTWFTAVERRWTLALGLPWLLLTWISTVMLGWHYAVDGLAGVAVVATAIAVSRAMMGRWTDGSGVE